MKQGGNCYGAGVHHGVIRPIRSGLEFYRVKWLATRFHTNALKNPFVPEFLNRHTEREGLGNGLDCECPVTVSGFEDPAVGAYETDAELVRVRLRQLGDI